MAPLQHAPRPRWPIHPAAAPVAPAARVQSARSGGFPEPVDGVDGPARLVILGVVLYLLLSANLLVAVGYPYDVPYGPFPAKLHPGTYAIVLGFLILICRGNPVRRLSVLAAREPAGMAFLAGSVAILVLSVARYGTSGSAFVIDTFIASALVGLVLGVAGKAWCRLCFDVVVALIALNALIGCLQMFGHWRLVPYMAGDELLVEDFFRPNALGGHPLSNASRTAVVALALPALENRLRAAALLLLLLLSLLAFGGRTALGITVVLLAGWGAVAVIRGIQTRTLSVPVVILLALGVPMGLLMVAAVLTGSDFGSRILGTLYWDESAQSRILVFRIFNYLDSSRLVLGIGPDEIDRLLFYLRSSTSLYYIENSWILLLLQFGVVGLVILVPTMLVALAALARRGGTAGWLVLVAVLVIKSSNNALGSKTQNLALVMPVLLGLASLRSTPGRDGAPEIALPRPLAPVSSIWRRLPP